MSCSQSFQIQKCPEPLEEGENTLSRYEPEKNPIHTNAEVRI